MVILENPQLEYPEPCSPSCLAVVYPSAMSLSLYCAQCDASRVHNME